MTDHILGHKTSPNKFKRTEIIGSIFSDQNNIKLQIRGGKKWENTNKWRLNNMLLKKKLLGQWRRQRGNQKIPGDE